MHNQEVVSGFAFRETKKQDVDLHSTLHDGINEGSFTESVDD